MTVSRIRIRALAHGGDGVGAPVDGEGPTWFVPGTLPGELVEASAVRVAKRFIRGELVAVVEPSPDRVPGANAAGHGGCDWHFIDPVKQPEFKARIVADQLRGVGPGVRVGFAGAPTGYRRRARLHYRRGEEGFALGFFAPKSRTIEGLDPCSVLVPALVTAVSKLETVAGILPPSGEVLALSDGSKVLLGLPKVKPEPDVMEGLRALLDDTLVGIEVRGGRRQGHVGARTLDIDGTARWAPIRMSAFSFCQANAVGNAALVKHVVKMAQADGLRVLELFAGSGNFSRALALTAQRVWASDTDHDAVKTLQGLAKAHDLPINAKRQSAANLLPKLAKGASDYDVIVLDPPRAGLGEEGTAAACRVANQRIVYVSCDPATLARDLKIATAKGFDVEDITVFDLMPMTSHIEIVATLKSRSFGG
ncbi:MAG: RsmD family RNA methyltransferase [Myxococcota bacterium]